MVRTDRKKNLGSVTDLKAVRIEKNLARLTELVNSSPETKARTMEYINVMAKSNAELQADYRARAKQNKKQLNYFISLEAHEALTTLATDTGKSKIEILESLLLGKDKAQSNDGELQTEINRLNAELAAAQVKIAEFEDNEQVLVAAVRKKVLNLSPAELAAINKKLNCFG